MNNNQLELIRKYCDTSRVRLRQDEKDLLCKILENPLYYDGFISDVIVTSDSGRDYNGRWTSTTYDQYRINIKETLSIDQRHRHTCDDGYDNQKNWDWGNAWKITEIREIIEVLKIIENQL